MWLQSGGKNHGHVAEAPHPDGATFSAPKCLGNISYSHSGANSYTSLGLGDGSSIALPFERGSQGGHCEYSNS